MTDPLGVPAPGEWAAVAAVLRRHARTDTAAVRRQLLSDYHALDEVWPHRWDRWEPPTPMRPGDLLALRSIVGLMDTSETVAELAGAGTVASILADAVPYWLSGRVAWGLAHTDIPDGDEWPELRLPAPEVSVWWSAGMDTGGVDVRPGWLAGWQVEHSRSDGRSEVPVDTPAEMIHLATWTDDDGTPDRIVVEGVVLLADDDGAVRDEVVWVVGARLLGGGRDGGWIHLAVPGRRSGSGWWQLLESLIAVVCWGDWTPERPVQVRNRGKARRLAAAGVDLRALGPVRTLAARHRETPGEAGEPVSTHASPATHIRRGHWRRQAVGPRGEARREWRWIAPTIVRPDGVPDERPVVYRLPPPEARVRNRAVLGQLHGD
ncbi:MAG TPA: hypothetical protein VFJ14_17880 [Nocardioidaceae bacterium]|nr:hypothetical protein [Nocardioidaceae bacterium]